MSERMHEASSPRVGIFICECGERIARILDTEALRQKAAVLPGVVYTACEAYPCSKDGRGRLQLAIAEEKLERVLIAGCAPRLVEKLFRGAVVAAGLDGSYLDVRNIREQCAYVHSDELLAANDKALELIEMGVARLGIITPPRQHTAPLVRAAMVIGSGLCGLTTALALADSGIDVTLIEESSELGGALYPLQTHARDLISERIEMVSQHSCIQTALKARVSEVNGQSGDYQVSVTQDDQTTVYPVGAIVVASGAKPKSLDVDRWYDRSRVKVQTEFSADLDASANTGDGLDAQDIVMILYSEKDGGGRSSSLSCTASIHQAIRAKELNPNANVTILFRDLHLRELNGQGEDGYQDAKEIGVQFFRYHEGYPPLIGDRTIDVFDPLTGEALPIPYGRVVLALPLVPQENTDSLASLLRLPQDDQGYLIQPRLRLRPGRFADDGVYVLGGAHFPVDTAEALFQAYMTSARVMRFLNQETITTEALTAEINPVLCTGCGTCVQVCPVSAINMGKRDGVLSLSEVDPLRCTGCGNCAVVCPVRAITLPGGNDSAILAQINAALGISRQKAGAIGFVKSSPCILAIACEWSAYAAADVAGARRIQYPSNVRVIQTNCSARFDPNVVLWAFLNGADGVFLGACYPGECHYGTGNLYAEERVETLKVQLAENGFDPRRLRMEFLSGDDGEKFAEIMTDFVSELCHPPRIQ